MVDETRSVTRSAYAAFISYSHAVDGKLAPGDPHGAAAVCEALVSAAHGSHLPRRGIAGRQSRPVVGNRARARHLRVLDRRCELRGHDQGALGLRFSPDGSLLASGGYGSHVKIWDVRRCAERMTLPEHEGVVASLAFSPDGRTLAVGHGVLGQAEEAYVALWSTATWEELFRLPAGIAHVRAVAFSADGKTLAAAGDNSVLGEPGTVRFWRAAGTAPSPEP